ncbi:MAG: sugar phosphate nucleotidyltransferase [Ignavibacteriaceae bacterium]|nr:sugar phosphate nucleotidyltransferase [Ignavibacteriaceae bacterium]
MNYAIIAAGEGRRLKEEGIQEPKPLIKILGVPLIRRLLDICILNGAATISCIINEESSSLYNYLMNLDLPVRLNICVKSTPSSLHSLFELRKWLENIPFVLMTTDTIFKETEFSAFLNSCSHSTADGVIAITDYVDDEKPLYVEFDSETIIKRYSDSPLSFNYITGGIYYFKKNIFPEAEKMLKLKKERLRNLLKHLADDGYRMKAFPFSKMIDVDHVTDIAKAEGFIGEEIW